MDDLFLASAGGLGAGESAYFLPLQLGFDSRTRCRQCEKSCLFVLLCVSREHIFSQTTSGSLLLISGVEMVFLLSFRETVIKIKSYIIHIYGS